MHNYNIEDILPPNFNSKQRDMYEIVFASLLFCFFIELLLVLSRHRLTCKGTH